MPSTLSLEVASFDPTLGHPVICAFSRWFQTAAGDLIQAGSQPHARLSERNVAPEYK